MIKCLCILICLLSVPCISSGAIIDSDVANDGYLVAGEYEYGDVQVTENSVLTVNGGGAFGVLAKNYSHIEIKSTSLPLSGDINGGGVWSIYMNDYSTLNFSGGATNLITTKKNSMVYLSGGQIKLIASQQKVTPNNEHIIIDCREHNWLWENGQKSGISGKWWDGTEFTINFIDDDFGFFPATFNNIKVLPEPASMLLLGLGGVLIKKRRR